MFSFAMRIMNGESTAPIDKQQSNLDPQIVSEQLEHVFFALDEVLRDDIVEAESKLAMRDSAFHKLGLSLAILLRVALGSDQKIMQKASDVLVEAEKTSANSFQLIKRQTACAVSNQSIYPPGSAFALCHAQSQLIIAIIATLSAKLPECIKGFYKFRKAYMTMQTIVQAEDKFLGRGPGQQSFLPINLHETSEQEHIPGAFEEFEEKQQETNSTEATNSRQQSSKSNDGIESNMTLTKEEAALHKNDSVVTIQNNDQTPDDRAFTNPTDIYIQSGTGLCFGTLLLMLSLIPPAFNLPLRIIGFKGNKEKGLKLLWQATKYSNLHGAMAGLMLLSYYNAIRAVCDILDNEAYPREDCEKLLVLMINRYPQSQFWMLEEARMAAANKKLDQAIQLLSRKVERPMKQVEALTILEKGLTAMFLHDYAMCADDFILSIDLNNWSHTLYYYIAGCCHVELYRRSRGAPEDASRHKTKAQELLQLSIKAAGSQRLMSKKLPFDVFVLRKIQKWQQRAASFSVDFIDAVGVSPIEEMVYFYGGHRRMGKAQLQDSLAALSWANPKFKEESLDELAIEALLQANIHTTMGNLEAARTLLLDQILCHHKSVFKGQLKDDWACPSAHYEMAVTYWVELSRDGHTSKSPEKLKECSKWLDKVSAWESYDLDARVAVKIKAARETLQRHKMPF